MKRDILQSTTFSNQVTTTDIDDIYSTIALVEIKKLKIDLNRRIKIRERHLENFSSNEFIIIP